jgi:hypothetical protein
MMRRIKVSRKIENINNYPGRISEELAGLNPIVTKGLVFLTLGGPQAIYNGGLLQVRLRYYDADKQRPGLPDDVGALVSDIDSAGVTVSLVNLDAVETRKLIMQAGAYGEHKFTTVAYEEVSHNETEQPSERIPRSLAVNGKYLTVVLPPGKGITLVCGQKRFVNKPSYGQPWK